MKHIQGFLTLSYSLNYFQSISSCWGTFLLSWHKWKRKEIKFFLILFQFISVWNQVFGGYMGILTRQLGLGCVAYLHAMQPNTAFPSCYSISGRNKSLKPLGSWILGSSTDVLILAPDPSHTMQYGYCIVRKLCYCNFQPQHHNVISH